MDIEEWKKKVEGAEGDGWCAPGVSCEICHGAFLITPKPHGCDFEDAPLGNKHCHYERKEDTIRNEQQKVIAVYVTWDRVEE